MTGLVSQKDSWNMFDRIARRYDRLNQVLSLGMAMRWRRSIVAHFPSKPGLDALDIATGTADIPLILARSALGIRKITGVDLSERMLAVARRKLERAGHLNSVDLKVADGQALPFQDDAFDVVTVGFGLRNFPDLMKGITEAYRVLRAGGVFIILEFSRPTAFPLCQLHALYLKVLVPLIGSVLTGDREAYAYLSRTAAAFPYGERFERIIRQAGFRDVKQRTCFFGAATLYISFK